MFKRIFFIALLACFSIAGIFSLVSVEEKPWLPGAEEYKVIKVQGKIIFEKTGTDMKTGDVYISGTPLSFATNESRAAVISKENGRFVLSGNTKGKIKVLPAANNIDSRGGALLNIVDLKKHFEGRYLVIKRSEVQIGYDAFPMDKEHFFYVVYEHNGEKIPKQLSHEGDFLILDKDEIFKIDGNPIPVEEKEMTLYYRKDGKGWKINDFTPIFPDPVELKSEVNVLLEGMPSSSDSTKFKEVNAYLNEFYGAPHDNNLNTWLKAEFGIEK